MRRRRVIAMFLSFLVATSLGAGASASPPPYVAAFMESPNPKTPIPAAPKPDMPKQEAIKPGAAKPDTPQSDPTRFGPTATAVSRDQAVGIARDLLVIPAELGEPSVSLYATDRPGTRTTWGLTWQTPKGGMQPTRSYHVTVDATSGEVADYKLGIQTPAGPMPADDASQLQFTRAEALELAQAWVDKLAQGRRHQLEYRDRHSLTPFYESGTSHVFRWERTSNGIPVTGQGVTVGIDGRTGELLMYGLSWNQQDELPPPIFYLPNEQAAAAYRSMVNLELTYMQTQPNRSAKVEWHLDQPEWRLVFRPRSGPFPVLDAMSGRLRTSGEEGRVLMPEDLGEATLLPALDEAYQPPASPLTQTEALAVASAVSGVAEAPQSVNFSESAQPTPRQVYHFNWSVPESTTKDAKDAKETKPASRSVSVAVDALKGVIDSFSSYGPFPSDQELQSQVAFPKDKARDQALAFIAAHRPDLAGRLRLVPLSTPEDRFFRLPGTAGTGPIRRTYRFHFQYTANGIPVQNANVSVEVSTITGAVTQFNNYDYPLQQSEAPFPAVHGAIGAEEALNALLAAAPLTLRWQTYQDWMAYKFSPQPDKEPQRETALVWAPDLYPGGNAIDAISGHLLDSSGKDLTEAARSPLDIAGHRYQKEIELMLARDIMGLTEGRFQPDVTVTRAEAARLLAQARGVRPYDRPARFTFSEAETLPAAKAAYIQSAYDAGIVAAADEGANFRPDETVTREEFALWAVRAMGFGAVAAMDATVAMSYADASTVTPRYRNAVALLAGLKVLPGGSDVTFAPQEPLRRGDAARILFSILTRPR